MLLVVKTYSIGELDIEMTIRKGTTKDVSPTVNFENDWPLCNWQER